MQELTTVITPNLRALREAFVDYGFDLRLVGGCVRDLLSQQVPKDIDLCTDADPEQQMLLYAERGVTFYETGLQHGTLTVNLGGEIYEITSARTETNHDGRHADVAWTRDWIADLGRRDLTINAMALTFDGDLIDPFGGQADLAAQRVRFVGNARQRIEEDYLRILRFIRFHARFAGDALFDAEAGKAIEWRSGGLRTISKERIWAEVSKIIAGPHGPQMMRQMVISGLTGPCEIGGYVDQHRLSLAHQHTRNPVTLLTAWTSGYAVGNGQRLRWSLAEQQLSAFLVKHMERRPVSASVKALLAVERAPVEHVVELALMFGDHILADFARLWPVPDFPVNGHDLLARGLKGPAVGKTLTILKQAWANSDYEADKAQLMALVTDQ